MPQYHRSPGADEVNVLTAVDVGDGRTYSTVDDQRRAAYRTIGPNW